MPESVRDEMTFHLADEVDDVLRAAFAGQASSAVSQPASARAA